MDSNSHLEIGQMEKSEAKVFVKTMTKGQNAFDASNGQARQDETIAIQNKNM